MNVKIIVFDLDDTLYNEITYVESGFSVVASFFAKKYNLSRDLFFEILIKNLALYGRGKVFDNTLLFFNIFTKSNLKKSISIYRTHIPNITLTSESKEILDYYYSLQIPLYLVTDGNKIVQNNKIEGLKIEKYFKKIFITHRYGLIYSKPSTYCFEKIAQFEKVSYNNIVYIGDNINKDFIGIKKLGFQTIRIRNGLFKNVQKSPLYHAKMDITSLLELKNILTIGERKNAK